MDSTHVNLSRSFSRADSMSVMNLQIVPVVYLLARTIATIMLRLYRMRCITYKVCFIGSNIR